MQSRSNRVETQMRVGGWCPGEIEPVNQELSSQHTNVRIQTDLRELRQLVQRVEAGDHWLRGYR